MKKGRIFVNAHGVQMVEGDFTDDGLIFKDPDAYYNDYDAPCYVAEYGFDECVQCMTPLAQSDYYTHNGILEMCNNLPHVADYVFENLTWQSPDTYLEELINNNDDYYDWAYDFVREGEMVNVNDKEKGVQGTYMVDYIDGYKDEDCIVKLILDKSHILTTKLTNLTPSNVLK